MGSLDPLLSTVADDPEVKAAAKQLALDAIAEASRLIKRGNPTVKASMVRAILPSAISSLKDRPVDETDNVLRKEMASVLSEVRGDIPE